MLQVVAQLVLRRPRSILVVAAVLAAVSMGFGVTAVGQLKSGGFTPSTAESRQAAALLGDRFDAGDPNLVLLVRTQSGVDTPSARSAGTALATELVGKPFVSNVRSYWSAPPALAGPLRSTDGLSAIVTAHVQGDDTTGPKRAAQIGTELAGARDGVTVYAGGAGVAFNEVSTQVTADLALAEAISVPITALVLVVVFGSLVAALLPLAVGLFTVASTLAILGAISAVTDVSIFGLNLTTALALALAVDYSLFIVSRYREELAGGRSPRDAVTRTLATAGRTVIFSALTIALSLAAMLVFPQFFLKSFAYAGISVVIAAVLGSLLVLPALLIVLGQRVNALDVRPPIRRLLRITEPPRRDRGLERTVWFRLASTVVAHAAPVAVIVTAALLVLGAPFLGITLGSPDDRMINDTSTSSRQVGDSLRTEFEQDITATSLAVLPSHSGDAANLAAYASRLSRVAGVTTVTSSQGVFVAGAPVTPPLPGMANDAGTYLVIGSDVVPNTSASAEQLVRLRQVEAPGTVLFAGPAAENADALEALNGHLPLALGLIAATLLFILFLFTGSVVLPVQALVVTTLSLSATFGAMVWIFQKGHLADLFGFTPTGYLFLTIPILMFCIAFGLSMDYEVFLLSRIREEWLRNEGTRAGNSRAVVVGLAKTGRIISALAVVMAIVFFAMVTAKVAFIQLFGVGLTLAVLMDATIVRGVLVPAVMGLLGPLNWWAPGPVKRLHRRIGLAEDADPPPAVVDDRQPATTGSP